MRASKIATRSRRTESAGRCSWSGLLTWFAGQESETLTPTLRRESGPECRLEIGLPLIDRIALYAAYASARFGTEPPWQTSAASARSESEPPSLNSAARPPSPDEDTLPSPARIGQRDRPAEPSDQGEGEEAAAEAAGQLLQAAQHVRQDEAAEPAGGPDDARSSRRSPWGTASGQAGRRRRCPFPAGAMTANKSIVPADSGGRVDMPSIAAPTAR